MKLTFLSLFYFVTSLSVYSYQSLQISDSGRYKIEIEGKIGFTNSRGELIIHPQFDDASNFDSYFAFVQKSGRFGVIDTNGRYLVPAIFDLISEDQFNNHWEAFIGEQLYTIGEDWKIYRIDSNLRKHLSYPLYSNNYPEDPDYLVRYDSEELVIHDWTGQKLASIPKNEEFIGHNELLVFPYHQPQKHFVNRITGTSTVLHLPGNLKWSYDSEYILHIEESDTLTHINILNFEGEWVDSMTTISSNLLELELHGDFLFFKKKQIREAVWNVKRIGSSGFYLVSPEARVLYAIGELIVIEYSADSIRSIRIGDESAERLYFNNMDWTEQRQMTPNLFTSGFEWFSKGNSLLCLNQNGEVVQERKCDFRIERIAGQFLIFSNDSNDLISIGDLQGNWQTPFIYDIVEFDKDYIEVESTGFTGHQYILADGSMVRNASTNPEPSRKLNINYRIINQVQLFSSVFDSSSSRRAPSEKFYYPINKKEFEDTLLLLISEPCFRWDKDTNILARRVEFINNTSDTVFLAKHNLAVYQTIQAQTENGDWKDIQHTPNSGCGNSYSTSFLPPQFAWSWLIPEFEGGVETEMRVSLSHLYFKPSPNTSQDDLMFEYTYPSNDSLNYFPSDTETKNHIPALDSREHSIQSTSFKGRINPVQFWKFSIRQPYGFFRY
ncbi:WG repeat-containing protein [Phaeocystidibacter marisrubri]|uniref:WG repeat-containing protein n=1 Tax=Phaeocystidibacter marisrubri TaxID=1577780 RepID=A0A6L3ZHV2_9FLAO|nr:WG repeat-containing protein [Phaeocystidibacter marisrubri]KAB2817417.1 WG repeat-containing protein [Phaeocystidibacter marisrubri]GGH75455.1 hypothetical protein GCM10011318_22480 [Phaeocystidibacter marisrubri]